MSEGREKALKGISERYYLFGLLHAFSNRMQTIGNRVFEELSWKQWFMLIGVSLFNQPPGISQVAEAIGSSHQNAKQILLKLEKAGFVELFRDSRDSRRTLVRLTDLEARFQQKYRDSGTAFMEGIYRGIPDRDIMVTLGCLMQMEQNLILVERAARRPKPPEGEELSVETPTEKPDHP